MDDERSAVLGEDIFKEPMEKNISVYFLQRFTVIPRSRANEAVVCALISPVEKVTPKPVLQAAQRFHTVHDICHGNPFAEKLKQPIAERFKADRSEHDFDILLLCKGQDLCEV